MSVKWRGSLIVFLFVSAVFFLIDSQSSLSFVRNINFRLLVIIGLIEAFVFLLGLFYVDNKIKKRTFSFGSLLLFNLALFIIFWVIFSILLYILAIFSEGEGLLLGLVIVRVLPIFLFLSILVFSLAPSIIFYYLRDKSKTQTIISYIFLVAAVLILFPAIFLFHTCNYSSNSPCLSEKASYKNDVNVCNSGINNDVINSCYFLIFELGKVPAPNENFCNSIISYQKGFNACIANLARQQHNISLCNKITDPEEYNRCVFSVEGYIDASICEKLKDVPDRDSNEKFFCLREVAQKTENISLCDEIYSEMNKADLYDREIYFGCITNVVVRTQNKEYCEKIRAFGEENAQVKSSLNFCLTVKL